MNGGLKNYKFLEHSLCILYIYLFSIFILYLHIIFFQCKQDSQIEVHSIRGDQVIFRAAKNYLNGRQSSSLPVSRQGSVKSLDGGNYSRLRDSDLERSLSTNASRIGKKCLESLIKSIYIYYIYTIYVYNGYFGGYFELYLK